MCGRYSNARTNPHDIVARFEVTISDVTAERALGRTNIAPTQAVLAIVNGEDGEREAILARFGLAPAWAKLRGRLHERFPSAGRRLSSRVLLTSTPP
jgi:putative SOS response-associated peptidase YedK